ncbi:MAG: 6-carboxytetrahydropterin synthase QueD [Elusimicrobia bacterium RIFOXYC2_FULL_34_12]|nr:MAG: 6-carboxytetrahydropterin synthase QueD [Elusimicrobia bacterium RIFOXYC2_FULL_34_12]OGS39091.1 MAG: 6-carboxytetrahydropterin synthase QueD [Elusimicrobia bacterium RIFOXYD2_FULL_34_30]HAM39634.1 6-carboxytetrahydropterin synthase QueD [Elusimicrobiota bacterium]
MFEISIRESFSAAHNLRNYKGRCEHLHGHNYTVEATVCGKMLDKTGMLLDFSVLKDEVKKIISEFDHKYLNETKPFSKTNPTAENIAKYIYNRLKLQIANNRLQISEVIVWETERNFSKYYER